MRQRLADDHDNARLLAAGLRRIGWSIDRELVQTNMFFADPPHGMSIADVSTRLLELGVIVTPPYAGRTLRLVTHYGVEAADVDRALGAFAAVTRTAAAL
jgi:threonine aldolase